MCLRRNRIHPKKALAMIKNHQAILIDVRRVDEYQTSHIADAILFSLDRIHTDMIGRYPDKTACYILYCRSGVRSKQAQSIMRSLGYRHVLDLGGILSWPYEVIRG